MATENRPTDVRSEDVSNPNVHDERRQANVRGILYAAFAMAVVAALLHFSLLGMFAGFRQYYTARDKNPYPIQTAEPHRLPPEPRLQPGPAWDVVQEKYSPGLDELGDLRKLRQQEDEILDTYGWVDRSAGVVRIPIARALEVAATQGIPGLTSSSGSQGNNNASVKARTK